MDSLRRLGQSRRYKRQSTPSADHFPSHLRLPHFAPRSPESSSTSTLSPPLRCRRDLAEVLRVGWELHLAAVAVVRHQVRVRIALDSISSISLFVDPDFCSSFCFLLLGLFDPFGSLKRVEVVSRVSRTFTRSRYANILDLFLQRLYRQIYASSKRFNLFFVRLFARQEI